MTQLSLLHESMSEALGTLVAALGGPKRVGPMLWPEKSVDAASGLLRDCLNHGRKERLTPDQVIYLLKLGRQAGCHVAMRYLAGECGYTAPEPVEPEDELARLQREYIDATHVLASLVPKIQDVEARIRAVK